MKLLDITQQLACCGAASDPQAGHFAARERTMQQMELAQLRQRPSAPTLTKVPLRCWSTHRDLRTTAEAVLPKVGRPSDYEIPPFDDSLQAGPSGEMEVVPTIRIKHRHNYFAPVEDCEDDVCARWKVNSPNSVWQEDADHAAAPRPGTCNGRNSESNRRPDSQQRAGVAPPRNFADSPDYPESGFWSDTSRSVAEGNPPMRPVTEE